MSQYKVPQNVDMQDKIVGPLTLFQFLYLLIGGMIFYGTLKTPGIADLIVIGVPVLIFSLAFAFVKINDQPFSRFIISLLYFLLHPKARVWHHGGGSPKINLTNLTDQKTKRYTRQVHNRDEFASIAQNLDQRK